MTFRKMFSSGPLGPSSLENCVESLSPLWTGWTGLNPGLTSAQTGLSPTYRGCQRLNIVRSGECGSGACRARAGDDPGDPGERSLPCWC